MEISKLLEWNHLTSGELHAIDRSTPVVIPLGSIEAHGHHLPMGTDALISESIARQACRATGALLLPTLHLAYLGGTKNYTGGIHMDATTCVAMIKNIVHSVFRSGFKKIILFNGHGPNVHFIEIATRELLDELERKGLKMQYRSWWDTICRPYHACEVETSVLLAAAGEHHLRPDKIIDNKITYPMWRIHDWSEIYPNTGGVNGTPSRFDIEEGKKLYQKALDELTTLLTNARNHWTSAPQEPKVYFWDQS